MIDRIALLIPLFLFASPAVAQMPSAATSMMTGQVPPGASAPATAPAATTSVSQPVAAATPALPKPVTVRVTIQTARGPIVVDLEKERAPITTANFLRYVDQKRFDNTSFYRAAKVPNDATMGLVQGGVRYDPKKTLPPIKHEPTTMTGIKHVDGTISMARNAPGTATGDFFIIVGDQPYMDADPTQPGDNLGYAAFGHVVSGMDIVRQILVAPTSATAGPASMKGQMLAQPVKILTVRRTK